jgi:hypothetical protein
VAVTSLLVSLVALLVAGWAGWYARQQTLAQRRQADAASASASSARDAVAVAKEAAGEARRSADAAVSQSTLEQERDHVARTPALTVKSAPLRSGARSVEITHEGPADLAGLQVTIRMPSKQADVVLSGFLLSSGGTNLYLSDHAAFPTVRQADTVTTGVQLVNARRGGDVVFECVCLAANGEEWTVALPCRISADATVASAANRRIGRRDGGQGR